MRVGLVRNVGLSAVALLALGLAGCDDNPLDVVDGSAVAITANPSSMIVPVGVTTLLQSRTIDQGSRPTWDDVTAALDATCGGATAIIAVAASYEPDVQPPGVFDVTGGSTVGSTCITLSGGGVTASVDVVVVGDDLVIIGDPGILDVFTTFQFDATGFGAGSPVTGLDPADVTWTSDNPGAVSIDNDGLATANASGTAVITATWTIAGVVVSSSNPVTIEVAVPVPSITSLDVANADAGDIVTITGTGFLDGPHDVFIDQTALPADALITQTFVDATTLTFTLPPGAAGVVEVTVGTLTPPPLGGLSNGVSLTRDTEWGEPANDVQGGGTPLGADPFLVTPLTIDNWVTGLVDQDDYWKFTLTVPTTFDIAMSWVGGSADMDLLFIDDPATAFQCGFVTATGNVPEAGQCALAAGDYEAWVNDYAHVAEFTRYLVTLTFVSTP